MRAECGAAIGDFRLSLEADFEKISCHTGKAGACFDGRGSNVCNLRAGISAQPVPCGRRFLWLSNAWKLWMVFPRIFPGDDFNVQYRNDGRRHCKGF